MAPGRPSPPFAGEYPSVHRTSCADSTSASRPRIWLDSALVASAVSADAYSLAESSRDVSDSTSGTRTLTPASVRGSLTSRLRD
jgi:hypothetical protein